MCTSLSPLHFSRWLVSAAVGSVLWIPLLRPGPASLNTQQAETGFPLSSCSGHSLTDVGGGTIALPGSVREEEPTLPLS